MALSPLEELAKYKHHLLVLRDSPPKVQKALLKSADFRLIQGIAELALNILNSNLTISAQSRQALERYKTELRHLAYDTGYTVRKASKKKKKGKEVRGHQRGAGSSISSSSRLVSPEAAARDAVWEKKRNYLVQQGSGAFLSTLITSALGGIVGKIISHSLTRDKK